MKQDSRQPVMYVFAGNNGSGKSTIRNLLIDKLGLEINIDPDAIARRIDPNAPEKKQFSAGKEAVKLVYNCIAEKKSFSIETSLAGKNAIRQMQKAIKNGFEITMFYIGLKDVNQNVKRIALRVKNGGHHIPTVDVLRRSKTSMNNLLENIQLIDNLIVIDNSTSKGITVIESSNNTITFQSENIPHWATPIIEELEKSLE